MFHIDIIYLYHRTPCSHVEGNWSYSSARCTAANEMVILMLAQQL